MRNNTHAADQLLTRRWVPIATLVLLSVCGSAMANPDYLQQPQSGQQPQHGTVDAATSEPATTASSGTSPDLVTTAVASETAKPRLRERFSQFSYNDNLPPGLRFAQFEDVLETQFYGTWVFYTRLNADKRKRVYEGYRDEQHITSIRTTTLDLLR